jgi:hypothetical protein
MKLIHTTETKSLIDLQTRDLYIDELAAKIGAVPDEINALNRAFEEKKSSMTAARDALMRLQVEKKSRELAIAEKEEEIRKHQRDLNMVKNNDAFKALLAEIESAKKEQGDIETEILGLMEEIDRAVLEDKKLQQEVARLEAEKNLRIKDLEAEKAKCEAELETAKAGRVDFSAKISGEVLEKYEFIRGKRKGLAIARVNEDKTGKLSCCGCNLGLTVQKIVDIKTPDALVFCDNCLRMIYLEKTVIGPSDQD